MSLAALFSGFTENRRTHKVLGGINAVLRAYPKIQVTQFKDGSALGLHQLRFLYADADLQKDVKGSGAAFSENLAILRAWGEFVERYSFRLAHKASPEVRTSNGFASHTDPEKAQANAVAELIERDVFLSCWLARIPARLFEMHEHLSGDDCHILEKIRDLGFQVTGGVFGSCMGHLAGIVFISSPQGFVIATGAKPTLKELAEHFLLEATITASHLCSVDAPTAIDSLPSTVKPMDHLRLYLKMDTSSFLPQWLHPPGATREFPPFNYRMADLTAMNTYALKSGYVIRRAASSGCQDLWFGHTQPAYINIDRVNRVAQQKLRYEDLNLAPHPLS